MNAITEARQQLAGLLLEPAQATGGVSLDHVPEELPTPCVVLDYADTPLERSDAYDDEWWLTVRVYVLVDVLANQQATEDLEALLSGVLPTLATSEWEVAGVTRPGPYRAGAWIAHGVAITVRNLITLTHPEQGATP